MIGALILGVLSVVRTACPATEEEALTNLYDALDGANWKSNNWLTPDVSYCSWTGITCDSNNNVIGIDLSDMGLTGAIPADIGCFPLLRSLYLNNNDLAGPIPTELCALTSMQYLQINHAGLTGDIPECICDLTHMMFWYMSVNSLTGPIPACVNELQFLKELHLDCNELTGDVPADLFDLPYMMEIHVQCNPNLVCTAAPGSYTGIYLCGTTDCDYCTALPPTNCPATLERDGCTYYRQTVVRNGSGRRTSCSARSASNCGKARSNMHNSAHNAQKKCNMPNSRSQTPLRTVVRSSSSRTASASRSTTASKRTTQPRKSLTGGTVRSTVPRPTARAIARPTQSSRAPVKAPVRNTNKPIVRRR